MPSESDMPEISEHNEFPFPVLRTVVRQNADWFFNGNLKKPSTNDVELLARLVIYKKIATALNLSGCCLKQASRVLHVDVKGAGVVH
jgi:hypothetical protein